MKSPESSHRIRRRQHPDGPYTGPDAGQIAIGGELNKLASNEGFGRAFAGIHWPQDIQQGNAAG